MPLAEAESLDDLLTATPRCVGDGEGVALTWLKSNPEVRDKVLAALDFPRIGEPGDVMLANPGKVGDFIRETVREARKAKAPSEVMEELQQVEQRMHHGLANLHQYQHAQSKLAELRGVRDFGEFENALVRGASQSPDPKNKQKLEEILAVVRKHHQEHHLDMASKPSDGPIELLTPACAFCCALVCFGCSPSAGCSDV
jgi:hypothetical protein